MEYVLGYGLAAAALYGVFFVIQKNRRKKGLKVVSWLPGGGGSTGPSKTQR